MPRLPDDAYRQALYDLAAGRERTVDRAVEILQEAARRHGTADLLNDLAAAFYVRAHLRRDPIDLARALGAVERARRLAPDEPVVLFNRAVILDRLHLLSSARLAWEEYLDRDVEGPWAEEAATRRAALLDDRRPVGGQLPERRLVRAERDPQTAREWLLGPGLGEWAQAAASDPLASRAVLAELRERAQTLERVTGDALLARTVARIESAYRSRGSDDLGHLIRGHRLHAEARSLMEERSVERAEPLLLMARRELDAAGSPFVAWVDFLLLRCAYQRQQHAEVEERGRRILASVGKSGASALRGRTWWVLGSAHFTSGHLQAAGDAYRRAEANLALVGERRNELAVRLRYAALLDWTGHVEDSWRLHHSVLAALRSAPDPNQRRLIATNLAFSALELGVPDAAPVLQDEAVAIARAEGRPLPLANALLKRGSIRLQVGDPAGAEEDLTEAETEVDRIGDPAPRRLTRAQLRLEQGRLWRTTEPHRAEVALDEALAIHRGLEAGLLVPEVELEAARVQRTLGRPDAAQRQLAACLAELDRQRATVKTDGERIALADRAAEAYDELVDLLLGEGRPREALSAVERARGRRLREWWRRSDGGDAGRASPPTLPAPGAGQAVIVYAVLPTRLALWSLTDGGLRSVTVQVSASSLRRRIRAAREAVIDRRPEADERLSDLWDLLIEPLVQEVADSRDLLLVPDEELFLVPFAALRERRTGRYLVQDHRVALTPTLALSAPPPATLAPGRRSTLLVADPAFDRRVHPGLPRLPGAAREGVEVAAEYGDVELLRAEDATVGRFVDGLASHRIVHVAAHALADGRDPFRSRLILAPDAAHAGGELEARELLQTTGPMPGLLVLAACSTAGGEVSRTEGALGLAWAALARGSRDVVATLWDVDDEVSRRLFVSFHRAVAAGLPPAEALRRAQLDALQAGAASRDWAAALIFSTHRFPARTGNEERTGAS